MDTAEITSLVVHIATLAAIAGLWLDRHRVAGLLLGEQSTQRSMEQNRWVEIRGALEALKARDELMATAVERMAHAVEKQGDLIGRLVPITQQARDFAQQVEGRTRLQPIPSDGRPEVIGRKKKK